VRRLGVCRVTRNYTLWYLVGGGTVAAWRSGNVVGLINEVTLRLARLVVGWVTVFDGQIISVFHQAA